jgi:hypothetical protein
MTRRFSLTALLVATGWLSLVLAAFGPIWRTRLGPTPEMLGAIVLFCAGVGGAKGAVTGASPIRHSSRVAATYGGAAFSLIALVATISVMLKAL